MALIEENLWSNILGGTTYSECAFSYNLSEAEIDHLQISVLAYHDILWLQITIHDVLSMQVFEDGDYLGTIENSLLEIKMFY